MEIELPTKKNESEELIKLDFSTLVIVGANGSGKTRFGAYLEKKYFGCVRRISAQKSLNMPEFVATTDKNKAWQKFIYGDDNFSENFLKKIFENRRWGGNMNTHMLNDFEDLMVLLHTEEYETLLDNKNRGVNNETKLDKIIRIWGLIFKHRKLKVNPGKIITYLDSNEESYASSEMSDGERVIFYLIGQVICAPENSMVIIDEPEMHIHKSLIDIVFNLIEKERNDCAYIYLTHDIDFAISRDDAKKIWMKSYNGNDSWEYEILEENSIPEKVYLEILGSRKPILFVEGNKEKSIDIKFYKHIFPDYVIKPLGSCLSVIEITKSFNKEKEFHHIESFGLIDRDRRTGEEIGKLNNNIWVLDVAEIENIFLLKEFIEEVSNYLGKNGNEIFEEVKENVFKIFDDNYEKQVAIHFIHISRRSIVNIINFNGNDRGINNADSVLNKIRYNYKNINFDEIKYNIEKQFKKILEDKDYNEVIKIFNSKELIYKSNLLNLLGLKNFEAYFNIIIKIINSEKEAGEKLKNAVNSIIIKEKK